MFSYLLRRTGVVTLALRDTVEWKEVNKYYTFCPTRTQQFRTRKLSQVHKKTGHSHEDDHKSHNITFHADGI